MPDYRLTGLAKLARPSLIRLWSDGTFPSTLGGDVPAVSGSIASLALSTSAFVTFDLGPDWQLYKQAVVQFYFGLSAPTNANFRAYASDDGSALLTNMPLLLNAGGPVNSFEWTVNNYGVGSVNLAVISRYVRVRLAMSGSGNTAGADAKVFLFAFP